MPTVGVGRRFLAALVDFLLSLVWNVPFWDVQRSPNHFEAHLTGAPLSAVVLIWAAYYVIMETAFGGTVGKLVVGIRVVREDGSKPDLVAIVKRTLARAVDGLPYGLPYLLGAILVWTSSKHQRLGDRWAGTLVVPVGARPVGPPQPGAAWTAAPPPTGPALPPPPPMPGDPGSAP